MPKKTLSSNSDDDLENEKGGKCQEIGGKTIPANNCCIGPGEGNQKILLTKDEHVSRSRPRKTDYHGTVCFTRTKASRGE